MNRLKLKKKAINYLLPLFWINCIFNGNFAFANLKDRYSNQIDCNQETADFIGMTKANPYMGAVDSPRFFCINRATKELTYSTDILKTLSLGKLGTKQQPTSSKKISQYEIEGKNLVRYTCFAASYYSYNCETDIAKEIIGKSTK